MKLYRLDELKELHVNGFINAKSYLEKNIGSSSDEGHRRYCLQAGIYFNEDGQPFKSL